MLILTNIKSLDNKLVLYVTAYGVKVNEALIYAPCVFHSDNADFRLISVDTHLSPFTCRKKNLAMDYYVYLTELPYIFIKKI